MPLPSPLRSRAKVRHKSCRCMRRTHRSAPQCWTCGACATSFGSNWTLFLLLLLRIISNNKNNINKRRNNNKKLDFLAFVDSTDDGSCRHRLQNFAVFFFCISYRSKAMAMGYISYMKFIIFTDWVSESRKQSFISEFRFVTVPDLFVAVVAL